MFRCLRHADPRRGHCDSRACFCSCKNFKGADEGGESCSPLSAKLHREMLDLLPRLLTCLSLIWNRVVMARPSSSTSSVSGSKHLNGASLELTTSHHTYATLIHPSSVLGQVDVISKHVLQILNPFVIQVRALCRIRLSVFLE